MEAGKLPDGLLGYVDHGVKRSGFGRLKEFRIDGRGLFR